MRALIRGELLPEAVSRAPHPHLLGVPSSYERMLRPARASARTGTFRHRLPRGPLVVDRDTALLAAAAGRRVLHIGCTDWPFTQDKLARGELLHQKILACATSVLGVDVDIDGLAFLSDRLGGDYSAVDVASEGADLQSLADFAPDVVLVPDVIEHVGDAQRFFRGLAALISMEPRRAHVVLSTPNALSARAFLHNAAGLEMIHPDHVALYSPRALTALAAREGMATDAWSYYTITIGPSLPRRCLDLLVRQLSRARVGYADGLVVTLKPAT